MPSVKRSTERKFWKGLCKVFQGLIDQVKQGSGLLNGINQDTRKFLQSEEVTNYLNKLVSGMVKDVRFSSAMSWRDAIFKTTNSRELYDLVKNEMKGPVGSRVWQIVSDNVAYIKTIPTEWADYVAKYAYREGLKGKRPEEIEKELRKKLPAHMTKNLKCVARTECAKANAAIVQARAEMCGIRAYRWRAMHDERARHAHRSMDGIVVFYDDPPSPEALFPGEGKAYGKYHAGNTFNCRCYQEPIVDYRFMPDVVSVYRDGRITTMTKSAMVNKFGNVS